MRFFSICLFVSLLNLFLTSRGMADAGPSGWISVSDAQVIDGLSPLNWVRKGDFISASGDGASILVGFTGTSQVELAVDTSVDKINVAEGYPVIAWTVNGGALQTHQLKAGEKIITLASGMQNPVIDLYAKGFSPFENRYVGDVPDNSLKITGFQVDPGAATVRVSQPKKVWVNIGDSIMSGDGSLCTNGQGRPPGETWATCTDARASYGYLLAHHYGYRESRIAYGGYDWGGGLASVAPLATLIDQKTSTVSRLTNGVWEPQPSVVLINLGENGPPASADVTNALVKLRQRIGESAKIIVMVPLSGQARTQVTVAFNSYKNTSHDQKAFLLDLGKMTYDTADGQHPTAAGHRKVFEKAVPMLDGILSGS